MRVVIAHTDPEHPNAGLAAYRFGRVIDFQHPITDELIDAHTLTVALLDKARQEFPEEEGYQVWPERLEDDGSEPCPACEGTGKKGESEDNCPICNGAQQTSLKAWQPIDEEALRAKVSGQEVDIPAVEHYPVNHVSIAAEQDQAGDVQVERA